MKNLLKLKKLQKKTDTENYLIFKNIKETYKEAIKTMEREGEGLKYIDNKNRYYCSSRKYKILKTGNVKRLVKQSEEKTYTFILSVRRRNA
jgi:hypothetical protein